MAVGPLCDDNCIVTFDKEKVTVGKNGIAILEGPRTPHNGLWNLSIDHVKALLPKAPAAPSIQLHQSTINVITNKKKTIEELVQFLHASCCNPSPSTFIVAVKNGNFITWPGLTAELIEKYLPPSSATIKGHLKQERKNIQSTKRIQVKKNLIQSITHPVIPNHHPLLV